MEMNTGGPAFPLVHEWRDDPGLEPKYGMTLRDYFAAVALQGIIAGWGHGVPPGKETADAAYSFADEMLKAREA
jgi:hypothetical protein